MYIVNREYYWDVYLRSVGDAAFAGWASCLLFTYLSKRLVFYPFLPIFGLVYFHRSHDTAFINNKKYFDMCNVGEQYLIGRERNKVLRDCNRLLDTEDF